MIVGIGIDVTQVSRFSEAVARTPGLLDKIFTPAEHDTSMQRMAGRFAAKEAFAKVTGGGRGVGWHHVEILGGGRRPPEVVLHGPAEALVRALGASRVLVSLSHDAGIAVAVMILEGP
ncbi:MAG: holo-ACP synthase, partial [Actinobacteria bacterium]|nr:holo-ACP synthase [Actinomycetota bacterium]